jgi:hypothetical protein
MVVTMAMTMAMTMVVMMAVQAGTTREQRSAVQGRAMIRTGRMDIVGIS